jgi:hypothetical protein
MPLPSKNELSLAPNNLTMKQLMEQQRDSIQGSGKQYSTDVEYELYDTCIYGGIEYISIYNVGDTKHTNQQPNISPTYWQDKRVFDGVVSLDVLDDYVTDTELNTALDDYYTKQETLDLLSGLDIVYTGAYGITWNNTNDIYIRTGSSNYKAIQALMRRCVLNIDGTVNYYLHPTNSNYKADGTLANLDGTDGNVMVEIPKFYVKFDNTEGAKNVSISLTQDTGYTLHPAFIKGGVEVAHRYYPAYEGYNDSGTLKSISGVTPTRSQTRATFRTQAENNGTGWHLIDWNLLNAIQVLCLIEIGTWDAQAILGNGNSTGNDFGVITGISNSIGNASTSNPSDTWMSYRGIENLYADIWKFIDGINVRDRVPYINSDYRTFADDTFTGDYISSNITMPSASASYIKNITFSLNGFISTEVGGSSNTYVPDGLWTNTGDRVVFFGGTAADSSLGGLGSLAAGSSSAFVSSLIVSGVCF